MEAVIKQCIAGMLDKLSKFKGSGYSFEEWFNWELYYAFITHGMAVSPKPQYNKFSPRDTHELGDLLVADKYFLEVGLIHDQTSNKWLGKLEGDRQALMGLNGSDVKPVQLLIMVSAYDSLEQHPNWEPWLNKLSFWNEPSTFHTAHRLPCGGQVVLRYWEL